ncbi:hypothetical protein BZA70DRAFT_288366 [Myxozyma melibiosi]|uniref:GDP/GTP exchange factor Sec2 N-terminal domain-containing protein n=1 Tax=Myxozyma melibiosi TaxID=54550 RepID=A0ABR1FAY3_9ASCO
MTRTKKTGSALTATSPPGSFFFTKTYSPFALISSSSRHLSSSSSTDSDEPDSPPRHSSTTTTTTTTTTAVPSRSHSSSSRSWKRSSRSSPKEHNNNNSSSSSSSKRSTEPAADDEETYAPAIASASAVSLAADPREEVDILSREVAALSTKLILAVERQADLEDSLVATKHELEVARSRVAELEEAERAYSERLEKGLLVDRKDVEHETSTLMKKLMEESRARLQAESDRRSIEQELEDLTGTLFDEANKMVASAMRRQDALEHRNKQLESVIHEKDNLLESLQEQLAALKQVLQDVTDAESQSQTPSAPSSPKSGETESSEENR